MFKDYNEKSKSNKNNWQQTRPVYILIFKQLY